MSASRTSTAGRYICAACQRQAGPAVKRRFTTSAPARIDPAAASKAFTNAFRSPAPQSSRPARAPSNTQSDVMSILNDKKGASMFKRQPEIEEEKQEVQFCHRLYIYATKHNTHITLTQPQKSALLTVGSSINASTASAAERRKMVDTLISMSTGNIGFRKSGRGTYDAAFQLGSVVMRQMQEKGILAGIDKLEVVLRGFGAGRMALEKILLGTEGRLLRPRIVAVMDATRLKFGGNRSPRPRRLG